MPQENRSGEPPQRHHGLCRVSPAEPLSHESEAAAYQATDPEVFEGGVGNIPDSEIYGAELELSTFLSDSVILDLRMSWLDTEFTADHL